MVEKKESLNEKLPCVTMGGISVILRNHIGVEDALLCKIFEAAHLPVCAKNLLLILDDKNGEIYEHHNHCRGFFIPSYAFANSPGEDPSWDRPDVDEQDLINLDKWDALVYIPRISTERWSSHRSYFAYVLAHELEHAKVYRL